MRCEQFRTAASAELDGEPVGTSPSLLADHLSTCAECARWRADAVMLTRRLRLSAVSVPDLSGLIIPEVVAPARAVLRRRTLLRLALLLIAAVQLAVAIPSLFGHGVGMAMSTHAAHESAAWNLALGGAFVAAALRPRRAAGMIAVLATFLAVLTVLSVRDVADGAVDASRLLPHAAAAVGLVELILLDRQERIRPPGPARPRALPVEGPAESIMTDGTPAVADGGTGDGDCRAGGDGRPGVRGVA